MRKIINMIPFILMVCLLPVISCSASQTETSFTRISMEEAKKMMEMDDGHVIVDVRTEEEYASGHIPGAICIPNETIYKDRPANLPDLNQVILVYCRSGNRSKRAARMLYEMGYTNVYEFGGIIDWDGEIEKTRKLSTFSVYRYGEIRYDSYSIFLDEDGYHVSVNDEEPMPMNEEVIQVLIDVIETYNISSWDGFSEENENVLDGEGFSLEIGFTDGTSVKAQGDNAFPDRYADAMGEIWDILTGLTEEGEMKLFIDGEEVPVTWEENNSIEELRTLLPLTIRMSMYGGFEQVGPIGESISANDTDLTTKPGDIVLYATDQIVIFYGSNSWAYTKLGHIDLSGEEMTSLLGFRDVTVEITDGS